MKKTIIGLLAVSATALGVASAQGGGDINFDLELTLDATVDVRCGVFSADSTGNFDGSDIAQVDFGSVTDSTSALTESVSLVYACNDTSGFTRTITSAQGGSLALVGATSFSTATTSIPYTVNHTGGNGLDLTNATLTSMGTPTALTASEAFLAGVDASISFTIDPVRNDTPGSTVDASGVTDAIATTVFAGDYVDTVTIEILADLIP